MSENRFRTLSPAEAAVVIDNVKKEISRVIVGQEAVVEETLTALFAGGHVLLVGVPGLAKTLLVRTIADILDLQFNRIQFTPDLMPMDITGTDILRELSDGGREFAFIKGPIFANMILADEINRTPPKTQSALLQAMQEHAVTAGGRTFCLEPPFFVLATQNPIEQEGTYPLPEAQLDRFMFNVRIDYPSSEDEIKIAKDTTTCEQPQAKRVVSKESIIAIQRQTRLMPAADNVVRHAVALARATRPNELESADFVKKWVAWGAGPRASQYLILGAKSRAFLRGANAATIEDVRSLALPTLRHRVIPNFSAEAEGVSSDMIIRDILERIKPDSGKI
ncbi:MAG TPA: MoxR family ATPase [bacterium]|nr:MoxR family ATPase [bacterium]HPN94167.1 MoxR family ATPase [bacterium]